MTKFRCYGAVPKIDFFDRGYMIVSEEFKSLIDSFEPGIHQFFPIQFIAARKKVIGEAYAFVPCAAIRCFSTLSMGYEPIGWKDWGNHIWHVQPSCHHPRTIFDEVPAEGHHLWVAVDHWKQFILISNALKNAIVSAGLTNLVFSPIETEQKLRWTLPEIIKSRFAVDPPWQQFLAAEKLTKAVECRGSSASF